MRVRKFFQKGEKFPRTVRRVEAYESSYATKFRLKFYLAYGYREKSLRHFSFSSRFRILSLSLTQM